ncbi:uncharacterized protein LOC118789904 [Megalops cyprinoides]|uniref:uncharacterized protein LOC118789904 n=1 Tax=Megalops cyprinoides TaxID=118141 RepID=UPI001863DD0B|nr:uncharacterized protein LOC118789904 [Megalops cyprinoides]
MNEPAEKEQIANTEKISVRQAELSPTAHTKTEAVAGNGNNQLKHGLECKITDNVKQEVAQPGEKETIKKEIVAVSDNHKGKQEVLPIKEKEKSKHALATKDMVAVQQEAFMSKGKEDIQKETAALCENHHGKQDATARRKQGPPDSYAHADKNSINVRREEQPSTPPTKSEANAVIESHQAQHELAKKDGMSVTQKMSPSGEREHVKTKTGENHLTRQEVHVAEEEGDAKNQQLIANKERDKVKKEAPPSKEKETQHLQSVFEHHQPLPVAGRAGGKDDLKSLLKVEHVAKETVSDDQNVHCKQEVLAMSEKQHAQGEMIAFDETHQVKLDVLSRRRKEKAEKYARANMDTIPVTRHEHPPMPPTETEAMLANEIPKVKHEVPKEDKSSAVPEMLQGDKGNTKNETVTVNESIIGKEACVTGDRVDAIKDLQVNKGNVTQETSMVGMNENQQTKYSFVNKEKGGVRLDALPSLQNIRKEPVAVSESQQVEREALATIKKQNSTNFVAASNERGKVRAEVLPLKENKSSHAEIATNNRSYKAKQGSPELQGRGNVDRDVHATTHKLGDKQEAITSREVEDDKKEVARKENESARMQMNTAKDREFAKRDTISTERVSVGKDAQAIQEKEAPGNAGEGKGDTMLHNFTEMDRDNTKNKECAVKERNSIKQELLVTKGGIKQEVLESQEKELIRKGDFADKGNGGLTSGNFKTKDRDDTENKEYVVQERDGNKQKFIETKDHDKQEEKEPKEKELIRSSNFAGKRKDDTKLGNLTTIGREDIRNKEYAVKERDEVKPEDLVRKYQVVTENVYSINEKDHRKQVATEATKSAKQELIARNYQDLSKNVITDHATREGIAAKEKAQPKQEILVTKEREPIKNEIFAHHAKDHTTLHSLSTKDTDGIRNKQFAEKEPSKQVASATKEKDLAKQEVIVSKGDVKQEVCTIKGILHVKPEVLSVKEKVHRNPESFATTDQAKGLSRKEVVVPGKQGHYVKHVAFASDEKDSSLKEMFAPKGNSKDKMEVTNKQSEMKALSMPREREKEMLAMREHKAKVKAAARQELPFPKQEVVPRHDRANPAVLTTKEKNVRYEFLATEGKENARTEALENKEKMQMVTKDRQNHNVSDRSTRELRNQHPAATLPLQVNGRRGTPGFSKQPVHADEPTKESYLTVGGTPQYLEQDSSEYPSLRNMRSAVDKKAEQKNMPDDNKKDMGQTEVLQYYAISGSHENETEIRGRPVPSVQGQERVPSKVESELPRGEVEEAGRAQSPADYVKSHTPTPRSNSSSPSPGKPVLFKVKDNTFRASPVTKTVKPRLHKMFPEDSRLGSSRESLTGSEKGEGERDHPKECTEAPLLHSPAIASTRVQRMRSHSAIPTTEFITAREPRGYHRRNPLLDDDDTNSVISAMSEDIDSFATSIGGLTDGRVSSSVYLEDPCERPDSACSFNDTRPLGKPPAVPPKSEKALRRAKRLTTRRIKKAEAKANPEGVSEAEEKPIRTVASMPASPTDVFLSQRPVHGPPLAPHYHIEPGYVPRATNVVPQSFPMTQRKLLQDPNSGQYFVVDMPVQVKTKMFFDPETGKYIQLSVRQSPEGNLSNASSMEVLNPPYMLYPGFLPVPTSSLPPLRSTSQMSAPASLMEDQEKYGDPWRQEAYRQNCNRETQPYIEPVSHDQQAKEPSYGKGKGSESPRNLDIIPMSELEDFAVESM